MSQQSRKRGRPTVRRDPSSNLPLLQQRQRILRAAAERWDNGRSDDEVVIMASTLRIIFEPPDQLLNRVVSMKRVLFVDSQPSQPAPPGTVYFGVGGFVVSSLAMNDAYLAPLCHQSGYDPGLHFIRFHDWWDTRRPLRLDNRTFTRQFLVHETANTDAVHVDPVLDAEYNELRGGR